MACDGAKQISRWRGFPGGGSGAGCTGRLLAGGRIVHHIQQQTGESIARVGRAAREGVPQSLNFPHCCKIRLHRYPQRPHLLVLLLLMCRRLHHASAAS